MFISALSLLLPKIMKKLFILILLVAGFGLSNSVYAQSGGTKREGRAKTKKVGGSIFNRKKSKGNADEFSRGNSGRKGRFARLLHKDKPAWQYKSSGSVASHRRENRFLFFRNRSQGLEENEQTLNRQNAKRAQKRVHGSETFGKKKLKRKKK